MSNLERDTVARVSKGVFEFIGIPERFLRKVEDDKCFKCSSSECAMVNWYTPEDKEEKLRERTKKKKERRIEMRLE